MQNLWQDIRFALRMLRKTPGFTFVAILTLALGIGANTAIFSIANVFLFRPLPVKDADRLVAIGVQGAGQTDPNQVSYADFLDYQKGTTTAFTGMTGYVLDLVGLGWNGHAHRIAAAEVPSNFFSMLGIQPAAGRLINPCEGDQPHTGNVVVLGYSYWQKRFAGDPRIVGSTVSFDGHPATIIGVVEQKFHGPYAVIDMDAYAPMGMHGISTGTNSNDFFTDRGATELHLLAILKPGVTIQQAEAALNVVGQRLAHDYPQNDQGQVVRVVPEQIARPEMSAASSLPLIGTVFLGMVGLVLLVACINVANLLFARGASRQKEIAIRASMGAERIRLIRQMLVESVMLAVAGGAGGALLGMWVCRALEGVRPLGDFPVRFGFTFDWRVFSYVTAIAAASGILAGLAPALRVSKANLNDTLREGGRGLIGDGGRRHIFRNALVIAQVAGSLIVLVAAGLFTRSLGQVQSVNFGFDPRNLLNVGLNPELQGYDQPRTEAFLRELLRRAQSLPGVTSAAVSYNVPLSYYGQGADIRAEGQVPDANNHLPGAGYNMVDPNYFMTMRMPIVAGRGFTDADTKSSQLVAVINESMARRVWPNQDALGRRFSYKGEKGPLVTVVGIARNARLNDLLHEPTSYFFVPQAQEYNALHVLQLRTTVPPESLIPTIEAQVSELDPNLPVYDVMSMEKSLGGANGFFLYKMGAAFAAVLGVLSLVLAIVGVYGVVSYNALQRTHEMGIRMALGAQPASVFGLVLRHAAVLVGGGVGLGLFAALAVTRVLGSLLVNVSSYDPLTFGIVSCLLVTAAFVACYIPAHRAMRLDPLEALRYE